VVHAADLTGMEVERTLLNAAARAGVQFFETPRHRSDLASRHGAPAERVLGVYVLDTKTSAVHSFLGKAVVLATGGAGKVYLYTSNPDVATGDGWRWPTARAPPSQIWIHPVPSHLPLPLAGEELLISEALRGEGGILRNRAGDPFMERYDPRKELAPRDVVARSIDSELKRRGDDCAYLDMTHLGKAFLVDHFPHIYTTCRLRDRHGGVADPVVPAAHYVCGGVCTDLQGRTSLPGLLAIGEVACTGLHGANRLASNSLLKAGVRAPRGGRRARIAAESPRAPSVPDWDPGRAVPSDEGVIVKQNGTRSAS